MGLDVVFFAILMKLIAIKLAAVAHNKGMRYPKPRGNILVHEGLHISLSDGGQSFSLSPFHEVIHGDYYISALPLGWRREGAEEIEAPLSEGPGAGQRLKVGGRGLLHGGVLLAHVATLDKFFSVPSHRRPIITESKGLNMECLAPYMVATDTDVKFVEYPLPLLLLKTP